ncbi:ATP-binding protein [Chitinophaga tropicalis]|uniref:AAA family ATPase n=1 Tax=Chitinophaga tropicalis TaxID=2683588 RepID=A0A7K1UCG9_9BACT|nr:ATP-binding protein [Chitinophaga tropicalis]MVT12074.1 AAA family ATPase [Chitinophaga tropicalis]
MARKYPIGLQSFREIREGGFVYIDKTEKIHQMVDSGKYYFLSRPRRFGKSLLLDTISELFSGSKELFKGLWIYDKWNWDAKNPVIRISFSNIGTGTIGLQNAIKGALHENAQRLQVELTTTAYDQLFKELITKAAQKNKVAILIDEYDKPLIDYLDNIPRAEENRIILKNLYSILKDADKDIRLLILTGVSRFSKVSIFSDLNNLEDITLSKHFNNIAGITQHELETNFSEELETLPGVLCIEKLQLLENIKDWYNGYSWAGKETVYNPFSLLSFMKEEAFRNFWFATGSPSFLVNLLKKKKEYNFENVRESDISLGSFQIENPVSAPLLFQTGYLTIKSYDPESQLYTLDYPNREVKVSLLDNLLSAYREIFPATSISVTADLRTAFEHGDTNRIINELNAVIGSIPYEHWKADTESIFHIITHLTFKKIGVDVFTEVHSSKGRADIIVKTRSYIYALELKLDISASEALSQIFEKGYLQPYMADERKKLAIGIEFSSEQRNIADYRVKEL